MKRIIASLAIVGIAALGLAGSTKAYFSDTEISEGNSFETGTIDIAVDDDNPWERTEPYALEDMKPSQTDYIDFTIKNVGTNPVDVFKMITITDWDNSPISEPECVAENGSWANPDGPCSGNTPVMDMETVIKYDMLVELYDANNGLVWHQMLYDENVMLGDIDDMDMHLGMIPVGYYMKVYQSYHMDINAGNEYQGDSIYFDITLNGTQLLGNLDQYGKSGDPDWLIDYTGKHGLLTYKVKDRTFDYDYSATGLTPNTDYTLVYYHDNGWPSDVTELGSWMSDGSGAINAAGESIELNANMINAKIWLVPSADITAGQLTAWHQGSILFETGLIDYYDADL